MKKESLLEKRILELAFQTYYKNRNTYSYFLNLEELGQFYSLKSKLPPVSYQVWGGYKEAERKMVCFYSPYEEPFFPISCIKVERRKSFSDKLKEELTHRDFLGSILGLGIERNRIGDIRVQEEAGFVFCEEKMSSFLIDSLLKVKNTSVTCKKLQEEEIETIPIVWEEIVGTVASLRLDSVLSAALKKSRNYLSQIILSGKVFVNGKTILTASYLIKEGDILSVRGFGKFIFQQENGKTRKGRYKITILKYK